MDNFFHCLQQGIPEQILAEISALSSAVNIAHIGVKELSWHNGNPEYRVRDCLQRATIIDKGCS